ncbi:hypothetical protein MAPG_06808 [Magnaporthiopsis poae ATCC 64411]|uniref:Methyltransferase domain-containing protein n=1 Tax=Magnaporthiopsis poae (strain ATCC 64411 / 73-15) TaxID=644358 RepID=A0A0C4E315_MAGP6|nr:hypothetical protein MAPG_06808 [Magnaporthiopsis poae ATCC 64411]
MTTAASGLCGNPRRLMQLLWLVAAFMFAVALVRSLGGGDGYHTAARGWMASRVQGLVGGSRGDGTGRSGRLSMAEHMHAAERAWGKTVKQRHELIRKDFGDVEKLPLYAAVSGPSYDATPYTIWDLTPASYGCPHEMERVGRMGDGGKWVCGMSRYEKLSRAHSCVVYSFGVRDESSFENELLSRTNCSVWAYDFDVVDFGQQLEDANRPRAHFMQAGVAGETNASKSPPFYSLADLMKMNGHDYIDILKMDIEFFEYETMDGLDRDFSLAAGHEFPVGQFMVELHLLNGITAKTFLEWWERLEGRGMRPTWTEPNLLGVTLGIGGNKDPNLAEYTMINVHDRRSVVLGGPSGSAAGEG